MFKGQPCSSCSNRSKRVTNSINDRNAPFRSTAYWLLSCFRQDNITQSNTWKSYSDLRFQGCESITVAGHNNNGEVDS